MTDLGLEPIEELRESVPTRHFLLTTLRYREVLSQDPLFVRVLYPL